MITLYAFGPAFGLPDPSPFVTKVETLLKLADLPYQTQTNGLGKAPKGKLPYIDDDGERIADSTFIRWHIEKKYKVDFDRGLSAEQRATAWAFEKMAEDQAYWALVNERWMNDANFHRGPVKFFGNVPAPLRPLVTGMVRRQLRKILHGQGIGRHSAAEITALATRSIEAISDYLGQKPFFMGAEPTGIDATMFAFVAGTLCPLFDSPIRVAVEGRANLKTYVARMTARFYPGFKEIAGVKAAA